MIINELQFYKLDKKHLCEVEYINEDTYVKKPIKYKSAILFEDSNYKNPLISGLLLDMVPVFLRSYSKIETFIVSGDIGYRNTRTTVLTQEEQIYLTSVLKLKSTRWLLDYGICSDDIRIFVTDKLDIKYRIINHHYNNTTNRNLFSIFIGKEFIENGEKYLVELIYDMAEAFIDRELKMKDLVPFNRINIDGAQKNAIVLNNDYSVSDIIFIARYYIAIFKCILAITNNDIINKFETFKKFVPKINSYFSSEVMEEIWEYTRNSIKYPEEYGDNFVDLINIIYPSLADYF